MLIKNRHIFACKLLNIEDPVDATRNVQLDDDKLTARNSLWVSFNTDQGPLWAARRAFLYEYYSPGMGQEVGGMPERLQADFCDSAVMPWKARFRVLRCALAAVGLTTAIPIAGAECAVSRDRLAAGYADLVALAPSFNQCFRNAIKMDHHANRVEPEQQVVAAAAMMATIVGSWNPTTTFKAAVARKRKRTDDGGRVQTTPFCITFKRDKNLNGEMELLHSINLKT